MSQLANEQSAWTQCLGYCSGRLVLGVHLQLPLKCLGTCSRYMLLHTPNQYAGVRYVALDVCCLVG